MILEEHRCSVGSLLNTQCWLKEKEVRTIPESINVEEIQKVSKQYKR